MIIKLISKYLPACLLGALFLVMACGLEEGGERSTEGETIAQTQARNQQNSIQLVADKTPSQHLLMPPDRDKQLAAIRKEFARLQPLLDDLPKETYEFEAEDEPYGESVIGWKEAGKWVKLSVEMYGDHGGEAEDFYLKDGKLFFYYYKRGSYYYSTTTSHSEIEEERLYFAEGSLIYHLKKEAEFNGEEKANMDRTPNVEIPLPAEPTQVYQDMQARIKTHIAQIQAGTEKDD